MIRRAAFAGLLCLACSSEPPPAEPQVVLYVTTDAPLPPPPGVALSPGDHPALFDALRTDVFPPGATVPCDGCSREVAVDRDMFRDRGASLGIMIQPGKDGYRARLRLFNARHRIDDEPSPYSSIDTVVALPPVGSGEVAEVHVLLPTDAAGAALGSLEAPVDPEPGTPPEDLVGTWIQQVPCRGVAREGEACIPGGAYWMGDAHSVEALASPMTAGREQRLVVLSPFFLDAKEVTVGRFAASAEGGFTPWTGSSSGDTEPDFCTHSADPERAGYPMNCVSWDTARAHCHLMGGDLPTEAQYEYAASGLRGDEFVWGNAVPECGDAVWGLPPIGNEWQGGCGGCRDPLDPPGKVPWRNSNADRLVLANGQAVEDLAGSVREWCLDDLRSDRSECWPSGVVHDPRCSARGLDDTRAVRGGSFTECPISMGAALRRGESASAIKATVGFRCARADDRL